MCRDSPAVAHDAIATCGDAETSGVLCAAGSESGCVPKLTDVVLSVMQGAGGGATSTVPTTEPLPDESAGPAPAASAAALRRTGTRKSFIGAPFRPRSR